MRCHVQLAEVADEICDGDLLLFRGKGFVARLIRGDDKHVASQPPFCSQACAMADRLGGRVDPTPHLADRLTEPGDLARSPFYRYRFTLAGVE